MVFLACNPPRALALLALGALLPLAGCRREPTAPRRVVAREATLTRQIEGLEGLLARAEQGRLLPQDELLVAVSEKLVKDAAALALPREVVLRESYRVRLETADVRLRDGVGSLRLDGRVSRATGSGDSVFAELAVFALIDSARLLPGGRLRVECRPIGFEVKRVGVFGDTDAGRRLLEAFAAQKLDELGALALPLDVPVQIEQALALKGLGESGPLRVRPARVPLTVSVARLMAFDERLWIAVAVAAGPWVAEPEP